MQVSRIASTAVYTMLIVVLGMVGTASALSPSHDYDFVVDQSQSTLNLYGYVFLNWFWGEDSGTDSSPVSGTAKATLTPQSGNYTNIRITELAFDLVNNLSLSLLFDGSMTISGNNLGLRMGNGYGSAGPATTVSSGNFNQTGNLVQGLGTISYIYPAGGLSGNNDLSAGSPDSANFAGTVSDNGSVITLTIPIDITIPFDALDGYTRLYGTIVSHAATVPEPATLALLLFGGLAVFRRSRGQ